MAKSIYLLTAFLLFSVNFLIAQSMSEAGRPEMADVMRSNGKIYVVVAVILTILIGLFFYLIRLEKKINKLEKGDL
ncbi:MAG TPA: CcmD family protein [Parasegetibacter sp.]